jgi:thiol-disulfide isomerase/thioredoxin
MFKNLRRNTAALIIALAALTFAQAARAQGSLQGTAQSGTQAGAQSTQSSPQSTTQSPAPSGTPAPAATPAAAHGSGDGHEYAPLLEQKINYKDWTFKSLKDGAPVTLRDVAKGKKLVMVVYFAPWCGNWKAEAPVVWKLYDKYRKDGFEVVGVSEYGSVEDSRKYFDSQGGAPFPVVVESEATASRDQTTHYAYRQIAGDTRRWGSPFNVFLEPARLNKTGDVLTEKAWVVGGELIEKDAEQFIREKLGLAQQSAVEPCKAEPAKTEVKKQ